MTLPSSPPRYSSWSALVSPIEKGETGWRAFAIQDALGSCGRHTTPDGQFGFQTKRQVKGFQENHNLVVDGVAGPKTQAKMIAKISHRSHDSFRELPDGLLQGYAEAEGANVLAATNWFTPSGGKPGVDCGVVQWRQYGPPFSESDLRRAFSCEASFAFASQNLIDRMEDYKRRRPSLSNSVVTRIALLAHNAPFLAEQIVRNGQLSTPTALATWTIIPQPERYRYNGRTHYTHSEWYLIYPDKLLKYT